MSYLVTGATGFIGRHLVAELLEREGTIYALVRESSEDKLAALRDHWGVDDTRVVAVHGDLTQPRLGVSKEAAESLTGKIGHFFHLAAVYDLMASAEVQHEANVEGTRRAVALAHDLEVGCLHLCSSIAAAGLYDGVFREDMFEEAEKLDDPYFRTKHDSEAVVRKECRRPWRIYRPSIVVGHSKTGEMDKIDGPYYFFKFIQKVRRALPPWMPMVGLEGRRINLVPVDFVARAMDHIAHAENLGGHTFHLTDPKPLRVGEVLNTFAKAAHAPKLTMRIDSRMFGFIPVSIRKAVTLLPPVRRITNQILGDLGIPREVMRYVNYPTRFDSRDAQKALEGSGIAVPPLESYAERLWDYWERNLDPDLLIDRTLSGTVAGATVLITGASSGIGKAAALRVGEAGARTILVARRREALEETQAEIQAAGGTAFIYTADLSEAGDCDRLVEEVIRDHGAVDILINNAGRSIRRSLSLSYDRIHDFERTMELNYFGALRLMLGFLPHMEERRRGHIINISSIGVLTNAPRFSAYVASKAALDALSRCAAAEYADTGIAFTTINMPLVRTPMIAPTKLYQSVPAISPDEAADMIVEAIVYRPKRIATRLGIFAQVLYTLAPKAVDVIMNTAYRLFPDSAAARGVKENQKKASNEQVAFAYLMRGIHW